MTEYNYIWRWGKYPCFVWGVPSDYKKALPRAC